MEQIINYFSIIPSSHRVGIIVTGLTFFLLLENGIPLFKFKDCCRWRHIGINLFFTLTTILVNYFMAFVLLKSSDWANENHFGILAWLPSISPWLYLIIGLLFMDFIGAFLAHWLSHQVKWLWRLHIIHHSDQQVDATTANRHHPIESAYRFLFTTLAVVITGSPAWLIMLYQSISVVQAQFEHANISLPNWFDKVYSWFFISPNMHKVHHHYMLPYTDANFGNIFSIWDRLFGTFMTLDSDKIVYGIDTHMKKEEVSNIPKMLKMPFEEFTQPIGVKFEN